MKNKICTDILQSKKLVEILPIESADMFWNYNHNTHTYDDIPKVLVVNNWDDAYNKNIPCWSLSALIELLPNKIVVNNENYFLNFAKNNVEYRGIVTWDGQKCISTDAENLLDACYNMIVKLKKDLDETENNKFNLIEL